MKFVPQPLTLTDPFNQELTQPDAPPLKFYKLTPTAFDPQWGTQHAACFDLRACLDLGVQVWSYNVDNKKTLVEVTQTAVTEQNCIFIKPGSRVMVPTNLIFDIPVGYSVRLHSRSGLALKQGLVLANHEGVVDADYVDPTFVVLRNDSTEIAIVVHGDRIAQAEMIPDMAYVVEETATKPTQKTDRIGGFGSTGTN